MRADEAHRRERFVQTRLASIRVLPRPRARDVDARRPVRSSPTIVHPPRMAVGAGILLAAFEDPDGIRLEINHVPGKGCSPTHRSSERQAAARQARRTCAVTSTAGLSSPAPADRDDDDRDARRGATRTGDCPYAEKEYVALSPPGVDQTAPGERDETTSRGCAESIGTTLFLLLTRCSG